MNMLLASNLITLDILIIVVLVAYIIAGVFRGFANYVFSFVGTFVAFVFAIIFCDDMLNAIKPTQFYLDVVEFFKNIFPVDNNATPESLGLPDFMVKALQEMCADVDLPTAVSTLLANAVITFVSFLVILIGIKIICFILEKVFSILTQLPIIGLVNRILGGAIGLMKGLFLVWSILFLISFLPITALNGLRNLIETSVITNFFYQNNIFALIFK